MLASLLEKMKNKSDLFANIAPQRSIWISKGAGRFGLSYQFVIHRHDAQVLFAINRAKEESKIIFDKLFALKQVIEQKFAGERHYLEIK